MWRTGEVKAATRVRTITGAAAAENFWNRFTRLMMSEKHCFQLGWVIMRGKDRKIKQRQDGWTAFSHQRL